MFLVLLIIPVTLLPLKRLQMMNSWHKYVEINLTRSPNVHFRSSYMLGYGRVYIWELYPARTPKAADLRIREST